MFPTTTINQAQAQAQAATALNVNVLPLINNTPVSQGGLAVVYTGEDGGNAGDDDSEEEEEAEVIFYSEGLSNHATSYVPSAVDTMTNRQVPFLYD